MKLASLFRTKWKYIISILPEDVLLVRPLKSFYGDKIPFSSVNLDEAYGKALAKKLGVAGQTLLIVKGETKINITNEGFMYARNNPDKFKSIIKEKIDPLVN